LGKCHWCNVNHINSCNLNVFTDSLTNTNYYYNNIIIGRYWYIPSILVKKDTDLSINIPRMNHNNSVDVIFFTKLTIPEKIKEL